MKEREKREREGEREGECKRVDTCHWSVDSHGQINDTHLLILWKSVCIFTLCLFLSFLSPSLSFLSLSLSLSDDSLPKERERERERF